MTTPIAAPWVRIVRTGRGLAAGRGACVGTERSRAVAGYGPRGGAAVAGAWPSACGCGRSKCMTPYAAMSSRADAS